MEMEGDGDVWRWRMGCMEMLGIASIIASGE
jgi:hypothetical protein